MNIERFLGEFLEYLEIERGRSPRTVTNYEHYLRRIFTYIGAKRMADITENKVRKFRIWMNREAAGNGKGMSVNTQNYHLIALRSFLKYAAKRDQKALAAEKIELARVPMRDIDLPGIEDLERLLAAPEGNDERALRDRAILELLFSTGLRVSELAALNTDTLDFKRGEFSIRGKGGKVRVVFLSPRATEAIKVYLEIRGDIEDALFVSTGKNISRLSDRQIQRIIKKHALKAGIVKHITPHTLRHLFATDLLINGADLRSVQALLGHSSITTTQVYTHLTDRQLREIHQSFHGKRTDK